MRLGNIPRIDNPARNNYDHRRDWVRLGRVQSMVPIGKSCLFFLAVAVLPAADDPPWKNKSISQWDEQDARQVLADSPWVKKAVREQIANLSAAARHEGGNWDAGVGRGVGVAGVGVLGPNIATLAIRRAHERPDLGTVMVRWESALPIRAAELKAGETGVPVWQGDYYAIAVYEISPPFRWNLANQLKGVASLQREKKKALKPARVLVLPHDKGLATIVYLFPHSTEIIRQDRSVRFVAQIGRLFISQFFFPEEMQIQGQPEL
jgi:hypothetical protein